MTRIRIKLKELYESKGVNQKTVSKEAGLRESTLSDYSRNSKETINLVLIAKLVDYFEIESIAEILEIVRD